MKQLIINSKACIGCRSCELACALQNEGVMAADRARIAVILFSQSREFGLPCHQVFTCRQCRDAPCRAVCPEGAVTIDSDAPQAVRIDPQKCTGCGICVRACPFGAVKIDPAAGRAIKCELCNNAPACVEFCPTDALTFGETDPFWARDSAFLMRGSAILKTAMTSETKTGNKEE